MREQITTENGRSFARGRIVRSFAQIEPVGNRFGFDHTSLHRTAEGDWLLQGFNYPTTGQTTWRAVGASEAADWLDANGFEPVAVDESACVSDGETEVSLLAGVSLRATEVSSRHLR